jgi:hypothetical protein
LVKIHLIAVTNTPISSSKHRDTMSTIKKINDLVHPYRLSIKLDHVQNLNSLHILRINKNQQLQKYINQEKIAHK